jgi:nitroimidazol reductase NimA-like FMN-containing flavoprotein (pyridoxamine 5'-phosphate oxidase superfamily)
VSEPLSPEFQSWEMNMDEAQRQKLSALLAQQHLAVIVTNGDEWPTATMQAFAETPQLDLLFIMIDSAEKFQNLVKRPKVTVLIDSRHNLEPSNLDIVRASIQGIASEVPFASAEAGTLKALFLAKNPFEEPYFGHPALRLVRVKPLRVSYTHGKDAFKETLDG